MKLFGQKLLEMRKANELTQQEVAEKIGKTRSAIANYESGRIQPSLDDLLKFSDMFRCPIDDLLREQKMFQNETYLIQEYEHKIQALLCTISILNDELGKPEGEPSQRLFFFKEQIRLHPSLPM